LYRHGLFRARHRDPVEITTLRAHFVHKRRVVERLGRRIKIRIWRPMVEAFLTLLISLDAEMLVLLSGRGTAFDSP
jgi:hypothetical protein